MKMNYLWIITIILLLAKVLGYLTISWFLVFLPGLISVGVGLLILLVVVIGAWAAS